MSHRIMLLVILLVAVAAMTPASNAVAQGENYVELLRQDIQTNKVMIMTEALELTEEQGEVFWPLYREYQTDLAEIGDSKIALIKDFAANYDTMTEDKAEDLGKTSLKLQEKQLSLLKKTYKNVSKKVGPIVAGRFLQIERTLLNIMDLQIASEMPLIK